MKDGYYWVRLMPESKWAVCHIANGVCDIVCDDYTYVVDDIFEIGDYIETPDKYKG